MKWIAMLFMDISEEIMLTWVTIKNIKIIFAENIRVKMRR